jgi:transposase InsO family protein
LRRRVRFVGRSRGPRDAGPGSAISSPFANAIFEYLEIWHDRRRRHSALGWQSPIEFENQNKIVVA